MIGAPSCALPIFAARHGGRLQKTERCATHGSLLLPLAAVAVRASCALPIFAARHGGRLQKNGALRQPRLRCFVHWTRSARLPSEAFTAVLKLDNDDD